MSKKVPRIVKWLEVTITEKRKWWVNRFPRPVRILIIAGSILLSGIIVGMIYTHNQVQHQFKIDQ